MEFKRFPLIVPMNIYGELKAISEREGISVTQVFRNFISLGLMADKVKLDDNRSLLIKDGDEIREIVLW